MASDYAMIIWTLRVVKHKMAIEPPKPAFGVLAHLLSQWLQVYQVGAILNALSEAAYITLPVHTKDEPRHVTQR